MKTTILAALVALAAGSAVIAPPAEAASMAVTTGDSAHRDNNSQDNGRHLGWYKHRHYAQQCQVTTHRHWRHGRLIIEKTRDC